MGHIIIIFPYDLLRFAPVCTLQFDSGKLQNKPKEKEKLERKTEVLRIDEKTGKKPMEL